MLEQPVVVMGVAGCGKSSLGAALASAEGARLIEGDGHHSEANRDKMRRGIPLTDADRAGWLDTLAAELQAHGAGTVLTCSALKRAYRDRLRAAAPGLRFVFMEIDPASARARIEARDAHFFAPSLVQSQFMALEPPVGEPGVLRVDALAPLARLQREVSAWLRTGAGSPAHAGTQCEPTPSSGETVPVPDPRFHDDAARRRYQLLLGDDEVGFIQYDPVGDTAILIKHAEVHPGHEGRGYASTLVRSALDHVRAQGKTVIPICPYTLNWVRQHPEYHAVVREDMRRTL